MLDHPAALEHGDVVGQQHGVEDVVGDQDRGAVREHPAQQLADRGGGLDVEGGQRLVEQQQVRLGGQRPGDATRWACPPERAAGRRSANSLGVDPGQPLAGPLPGLATRHTGAAWAEGDVVQHRQVREEPCLLREQSHPARVGRHPLATGAVAGEQDPVVESDPSRVGPQQPGDGGEGGGLAGAVGPEERQRAAGLHGRLRSTPRSGKPDARASEPLTAPRHSAVLASGQGDDDGGDDHQDQRQGHCRLGIGLALEVDLQRQGAGDPLQAAGEGDASHRTRRAPGRTRAPRRTRARAGPGGGSPAGSTVVGRAPRVAATSSNRCPPVRSAPSRLTTRNGRATKVWAITTAVVEKAIWSPRTSMVWPSSPRRPNV